jgi:serine/threonine protein kinase
LNILAKVLKEKKVNELINVFIKVQKSGNKKAKIIFENYLAIPRGEIYDINTGEFLGFAMKKFDMSRLKPISYFFDNNINQNDKFDKSFKGRYKIAKNLIETVEVLHSFGIIVGDLNDKNVFVTEKNHIGILDCDSFGIVNKFPVDAIMSDIMPPEAINGSVRDLTQKSDIYILAIIIYRLFMRGSPFNFITKGDMSLQEKKLKGLTPLRDPNLELPKWMPKLEDRIPKKARDILGKALDPNPKNRPNISDLKTALDEIAKHLGIIPLSKKNNSQNNKDNSSETSETSTKNDYRNEWFWVSVGLFILLIMLLLYHLNT